MPAFSGPAQGGYKGPPGGNKPGDGPGAGAGNKPGGPGRSDNAKVGGSNPTPGGNVPGPSKGESAGQMRSYGNVGIASRGSVPDSVITGLGPNGRNYGIGKDAVRTGSIAGRDFGGIMQDVRDWQGTGDTFGDKVAMVIANTFGLRERNPFQDAGYASRTAPAGAGAGWGFDPAGLIGAGVGMGLGMPFGGGLAADQFSAALGRPLEMGLGTRVLGREPTSLGSQMSPNVVAGGAPAGPGAQQGNLGALMAGAPAMQAMAQAAGTQGMGQQRLGRLMRPAV